MNTMLNTDKTENITLGDLIGYRKTTSYTCRRNNRARPSREELTLAMKIFPESISL